MNPVTTTAGAAPAAHPGPVRAARVGLRHRLSRGRPDDPRWVRPSLLALLGTTAVLSMWDLSASGWANSFYAAAVQAGTKSWKAFLFGSFDPSNLITVDKSPASLWVMELSGRIFGFSSWSMLIPQALEGVATVGLVYLTVRRWSTPAAALVAGAVTATTPVAALMFRFNNPDALLVLLMTLAAYATVRAVEDDRHRWMVAAGTAIGFAFLAKMLQAFLVVPALSALLLVAGPGRFIRRISNLLWGGLALVASAGWWVAVVQLTPAADRPYIGGSQDNSLWNLVFGYNGFGRLTGNETGSVGAGTGTSGRWGPTGITRLFGAEMGTQIAWLLPAALLLLVVGLVVTRRAPRTSRIRAALILWGGWLVVTGLAFSLGQGIIHQYYTVALAPAIGGLIGTGGAFMWANRDRPTARITLAVGVAGTGVWAAVLLGRTPHWLPLLRPLVVLTGLAAAGVVLAGRRLYRGLRLAGAAAVVSCLAGPFAYTLDTVNTPHSGAIPTAGPAGASTLPGPGGGRPGGPGTGRFAPPGGSGAAGRSGFPGPGGGVPGPGFPGGGPPGAAGGSTSPGGGRASGPGGGPNPGGGLLNASRPSARMQALLERDASRYTWVAATVGSNEAAGYQLATGDAVMALGGFNGTDPYPTLAEFEKLVSQGRVHYFIASGPGGLPGQAAGGSTSGAIAGWVESHFGATSVGGVTVYDLTSPPR